MEKVLNEAQAKLLLTLSERQILRERKLVIESIMKIPQCLEHLEKLLEHVTSETIPKMLEDDPTKGNVIERAANDFNQLQHLIVKCSNSSVIHHLKEVKKNFDSLFCQNLKCFINVVENR